MKQKISISVALVMLFNLSVGVFAQSIPGFTSPKGTYFPQLEQAKKATQPLVLATEEQRQAQEIVSYLGLNPTEYRKAMEQYAKAKKIDINTIDISASYQTYSKEIIKYNNDYKALIKIFDKKTYLEVLNEVESFFKEKSNIVSYQGKKYNKVAVYHAALHNLATRTLSGYIQNNTFIFGSGSNGEFSVKEKVFVMDFVHKIISNNGYYPKDEEALYKMAMDVVSNGKPYFKSTKEHKDETHDAKGVVAAISVLTALSNTNARKQQSAQAIYNLSKSIMRKELGAMGILSGSEALLALNTDDSLNKLYTLLADDLYRGWGTELALYFVETFSIEELQQRLAGYASEVNNGLGQYHNAIARRYVYVDPNKNSYDQKRLAETRDETLANYSRVIYTDIFEEIGKMIGRNSGNAKVANLASRFAAKYYSELNIAKQNTAVPQKNASGLITSTNNSNAPILERADSPLKRETKIHASLIVGILSTTKVKSESLTKAAGVIYNGNWWDINEITQRDKNNAAARYLNLQKKPFNQRKQDMYALVIRTKNVSKFLDVFAQAAMLGKAIVSMPAIITKAANWARSAFKWAKMEMKPATATTTVVARPVEVKPVVKPATAKPAVKPVEVKPIELKPIEVKPIEMPIKPAVMEPIKIPAVAQAVRVPSPQVAKVVSQISEAEMATITQNVKWEFLGKYYQRPAAMAILPFGLSGISGRLSAILTNRAYLSEGQILKVKNLIYEAAESVAADIKNGANISQSEARNLVKDRAISKIWQSDEFTAKEKAEITGRKNYQGIDPANTDSAAATKATATETTATKATATETTATEAAAQVAQGKAPSYVKPEVIAKQLANKNFKKYKRARSENRIQDAYAYINEAIKYDPKNAAYYHERGLIKYYVFEDKVGGMEDMKMAHQYNPKNTRYPHIINRWNEEAAAIKGSKDAPKTQFVSEPETARVKTGQQSANNAKPTEKQTVRNKEREYNKHMQAASLAEVEHNYELAVDHLNKAIKADPSMDFPFYRRALIEWYKLNKKEQAITTLRIAVKHQPQYSSSRKLLEKWTKELEEIKSLKETPKTELAKEPQSAQIEGQIKVENTQYTANQAAEVQKIAKQVKSDILDKYNNKPLMMSVLPFGLSDVGQRVSALLTNRPFLNKEKIALVKAIIDEVCTEIVPQRLNDTIPNAKVREVITERTLAKIQESDKFTAKEKEELANLNHSKAYDYYKWALDEWYENHNSERAIEYMKEAVKYNPDDPCYKKLLEGFTEAESAMKKIDLDVFNNHPIAETPLAENPQAIKGEVKAPKLQMPQAGAQKTAKIEDPKYEARQYSERARKAAASGVKSNYKKALEYYSRAIELDPTNDTYYYERALLKRKKLKDLEGGIEDLKQAGKYNPNSATYKETLAEWTKDLASKNAKASPKEQVKIKDNVEARLKAEKAAEQTKEAERQAERQAKLEKQKADWEFERQSRAKMEEAARQRKAEFEKQQAQKEKEIELHKQEEARRQAEQEKQRLKQEQAERAEKQRRARLTQEQRDAEDFYNKALESKERGLKQQAYNYFEKAIAKETRLSVKAQYSIEQARFLRYAKGTGRGKIYISGEQGRWSASYDEAALKSYDRAVECARGKVKVQYLLERADFKRFNKDFEGAKADTELAKKLDPTIAK